MFDAARLLLTWRGDGSTGWSYAWRIPLWARAYDGDFAYRQLVLQLAKRTFPNLFDKCGPFQVDGNFGATGGLPELLLQSHLRKAEDKSHYLDLLPALPKSWQKGAITGLRARGGFEVDLAWEAGVLKHVTIRSLLGQPATVRYKGRLAELALQKGQSLSLDGELKPVEHAQR